MSILGKVIYMQVKMKSLIGVGSGLTILERDKRDERQKQECTAHSSDVDGGQAA